MIGKNSFKDCSALSGVEIFAKAGVRMSANAFLTAGADAIYSVYSSYTAALLEDASLISRERIADTSGLLAALAQAGTYAEKDYTAESFGVLAARIREGEEILSERSPVRRIPWIRRYRL